MKATFARWLTRCLSLWVRPDILPATPASLLDPSLPVLYVLEVGGLADRAALAIATSQARLPAPTGPLSFGALQEASSVEVLTTRRRPWLARRERSSSPRLTRILDTARAPGSTSEQSAAELQIVPVAVYWGRAPDRHAAGWRQLFSDNWALSGRLHRFFTTLVHGRNTLIQFSQPLSLRTLVQTGGTASTLERKLWRILRVHFRQRRIASLGPDLSHRRTLIGQVLADAGVRRCIVADAGHDVKQHRKLQQKANAYATEIAADMSYTIVRQFQRPLARLWTGLYDGVDVSGIERLKAAADGREIVYVPCHRSHIDYLLLSYILYHEGFSLPHVAAGINLDLPVVGRLLRSGGAFFLRRSFAGNPLYTAVFSAYLKEIQQRGHAIEYFIEGGRSRTGRLLPPKGGMLSMTTHAYLRNPRMPIVFVPVYFGYERLVEGRSFTSELAGGSKRKETIFALFKSLRRLREDYGRVRVNVGDPIELDSLLDRHQPDWRVHETGTRRPDWLRPLIDELGVTIMRHINQAASVTPVSLLAAVLLASPRGSLGIDELRHRLALYRRLLEATHAGSLVEIPALAPADAIAQGIRLGFVERLTDPLGDVVGIRAGQAAPITYFRNNILHLLVLPALIASTFLNRTRQDIDTISALVERSFPFLQAEFFLEADHLPNRLQQSIHALADCGLISADDDTPSLWRRPRIGSEQSVSLLQLGRLIAPVLERYYLTAVLLFQAPTAGLERQSLAEQCNACAQRLALTHGRQATDLYDRHLFATFIDTLVARSLLDTREGRLIATPALQAMEADADMLLGEVDRHAIVHAARIVVDATASAAVR